MKKQVTASELLSELASDPEFQQISSHRTRDNNKMLEALAREEMGLLANLESVGVRVNSVWDLVNAHWKYPQAICILMKHLTLPYSAKLQEGIIRALSVQEACGIAGDLILSMLVKHSPEDTAEFRWLLANALTVIATPEMHESIAISAANEKDPDVRNRLLDTIRPVVI